ncbi:MAG: YicC family protein [Dysgonamonadaceae bacterium]|jgi:uncharacterized protein (TIGR00255 family)|nr:YicC family protein [Dysgonamonadaceae bacterium]
MIQSMTGFGKAETEFQGKKITIEIKSLNSKQLDINTRIPNVYREKEIDIRNMLLQSIERGKIDFTIYIDTNDKSFANRINPNVIKNYYDDVKEIAKNLAIEPPIDWLSLLLHLPDTIKAEVAELNENEWLAIRHTIETALKALVEFRTQEGFMLEKIFINKIENIKQLSKKIEEYEPERVEKIKSRLQDSLQKLETQYDENRFEQELIFYIERLDINEEKSRLNNHLKYFLETLHNENSQGRKLGFIIQEMGREINTLGSKSNHAAMQKIVIQMKDELEQIKEQILNVL